MAQIKEYIDPELQRLLGDLTVGPVERRFISLLVQGMNIQQASALIGMGPQAGVRLLNRENVRESFLALCDRAGLTDQKIIEVMSNALEAERGGEENPRPDHAIRLKAAELGAKLKGHFPTGDQGKTLTQINVNTNIFSAEQVGSQDFPKEFTVEYENLETGEGGDEKSTA